VHFFRLFDACQVEDSWAVVDVLHQLGYVTLLSAGQADEQRSAEGFFIHESLVEPSVFTHVESLVGSIDNHGVVQQVLFFQVVQQAADVAVNGCDDTQIVTHVLLVFPFGQCFSCQFGFLELLDDGVIVCIPCRFLSRIHTAFIIHFASPLGIYATGNFIFLVGHFQVINDVHVLVDAHFLLLCGQSSFIVVVEVVRQRESLVCKEFEVTSVRHPGAVRSLVVEEHTERLVLIAVFYPVDGLVGDDVGGIAFHLCAFAVHLDEGRVIIVALSRQDFPMVESLRIAYEVPLANHRCLIAVLLKEFRESQLVAVEGGRVVDEPVGVAVLSGEHAGTARSADGVGHETVGKAHTFVADAVNVRCVYVALVVGADGLIRVVIAHDVDDVHRLLGFCLLVGFARR